MDHAEDYEHTNTPHISEEHESEKSSAYRIEPEKFKKPKGSGLLRELFQIILIALFIVLPIRLFIAQPFIVSGASMSPTFETGHYLIIDELSYHLNDPERFDVVVFKFPQDPKKFFIKRIIGLPGETVIVRTTGATIIINEDSPDGTVLEEPYVRHASPIPAQLKLGESEYFVMGDNRQSSSDSRVWGPLPRDRIVGRALLRLLPISDFGFAPGGIAEAEELI